MAKVFSIRQCSFVLLICTLFAAQGYGQVDQGKLNSLKSKYPWGSIYLTHTSLLNLDCILKDDRRVKLMINENGERVISILRTFVEGERGKKINESVAFVEIDLNRVEAGFKKITDPGGEIAPLAWSKEEVVRIADVCDRELKSLSTAHNLKRKIDNNESIPTVWEGLVAVQADPYVSTELAYLLVRDFKLQLDSQEAQINELKSKNATLFESVTKFRTGFDGSFMSYQRHFWTDGMPYDNREFVESVRAFEKSFREPVFFRDLSSAIATLNAQVQKMPELFSAPSPRLQAEMLGTKRTNEVSKDLILTLYEHKKDLPETALERAALLAFALEDYQRATEFVDTGLKASPENKNLLAARGLIQYGQSSYPQALASFQQAATPSPAGNTNFRAALMSNIGQVQWGLGQTSNAEASLSNSIALFYGNQAKQQQAYSLLTQGDFYADYGQSAKALEMSAQALKLVGTSDLDKHARMVAGRAHRIRAKVALFRGILDEAKQEIDKAINFHQPDSNYLELAQDKDVQSDIEEQTGRYREALKTLQDASDLYNDFIRGQSENQWRRANILIALNNFGEAEKLINDASTGFKQLNDRRGLGECEALKGILILRQANHRYAERFDLNMSLQERQAATNEFLNQTRTGVVHFETAIRIFQEIGYKRGTAYAQDKLAINLISLAEEIPTEVLSQAEHNSKEAIVTLEEIGDRRGQAVAYGNLGIILRKSKQYELALSKLEKALQICREIEFKLGIGRQFFNLGRVYYEKAFSERNEQDLVKAKEKFLEAQRVLKETQGGADELKLIDQYLKNLSK